jgi:hypothetical protein
VELSTCDGTDTTIPGDGAIKFEIFNGEGHGGENLGWSELSDIIPEIAITTI